LKGELERKIVLKHAELTVWRKLNALQQNNKFNELANLIGYTFMEIIFASKKLGKQLNEEKTMLREHGTRRSKILKVVLARLRAAPNLGIFAPPYSPPDRCHELTGNRKGQLTIDLDDPYRLVFIPAHEPLPKRAEGGLDWSQVTAIEIRGVEDTHA